MGLYAGMMDEGQRREYSDRELLVRYIKGVAPFRKSIVLISLCIFITTIAESINPLLIGIAIDELSNINSNLLIVLAAGGALFYSFYSTLDNVFFTAQRNRKICSFFFGKATNEDF